jgi:short-chain fatty acids transporter
LLSYVRAVTDGGRAIVGIVIQFPLYSGIQGVMFGSGLAVAISQWFVDASQWSAELLSVTVGETFPIATFFSAAVVNLSVPSGGGQWIVQGSIMCGAAQSLSTPIDQTVMAIAYGDQLTNMVQPFWAIPLMGMTKVNAREFMGYCALLMLLAIPVFCAALLLF